MVGLRAERRSGLLGWALARKGPSIGETFSEVRTMFRESILARKLLLGVFVFVVAVNCLSGCGKKGGTRSRFPHYRMAVEAYREGNYDKALSLFQRALLYDRANAEIYLDMAAIYDDFVGDTARAISCYEKYLGLAGESEKAHQVRKWVEEARARLAVAAGTERPEAAGEEKEADEGQGTPALRERLLATRQALADEKDKTASLSEKVSGLYSSLSAALKENKELKARLAGGSGGENRRFIPLGWLVCIALGIIVVGLVIKQKYSAGRRESVAAGVRLGPSDGTEEVRKEDILGK